jgi:hypothetical protein
MRMKKKLQMEFQFEDVPKILRKDKDTIAYQCFWEHHQHCDCEITWRQWEEQTNRSIWELVEA